MTGDASQSIDQHELWLNSEAYAPLRTDSIPIGVKEMLQEVLSIFKYLKLASVLLVIWIKILLTESIIHFLKETGLGKEAA